jgi:transposase-like protein
MAKTKPKPADKPTIARKQTKSVMSRLTTDNPDATRAAAKLRVVAELVAAPISMGGAAKKAGISRGTIYDWMADDAQFKADVLDAREVGTDLAEAGVVELAMQRDDLQVASKMLLALLRARRPSEWDHTRKVSVEAEATGADGTKARIGIMFVGEPAAEDEYAD